MKRIQLYVRAFGVLLLLCILIGLQFPKRSSPVICNRDNYPCQISWSGYTWDINSFSVSTFTQPVNPDTITGDRVFVDRQGRLHLSISYHDGRWWSTEAVATRDLGYGLYRFYLGSKTAPLDESTVMAFFLWDRKPKGQSAGELDIEFSEWGSPTENKNSMYSVQPSTLPGHTYAFDMNPGSSKSIQSIYWTPTSVRFRSEEVIEGAIDNPKVYEWNYTGNNIPPIFDQRIVLSYWVNQYLSVTHESEFIIDGFEFIPYKPDG